MSDGVNLRPIRTVDCAYRWTSSIKDRENLFKAMFDIPRVRFVDKTSQARDTAFREGKSRENCLLVQVDFIGACSYNQFRNTDFNSSILIASFMWTYIAANHLLGAR